MRSFLNTAALFIVMITVAAVSLAFAQDAGWVTTSIAANMVYTAVLLLTAGVMFWRNHFTQDN